MFFIFNKTTLKCEGIGTGAKIDSTMFLDKLVYQIEEDIEDIEDAEILELNEDSSIKNINLISKSTEIQSPKINQELADAYETIAMLHERLLILEGGTV